MIRPGGGAPYREFAQGMNYREGGVWKPSEDLIELTPDGGARAVRAPHQAYFAPNINTVGSILQVTSSGRPFRSNPAGLFLYSPKTGKELQIAGIKDSVGELLPPNQILYRDCFEGVLADLRITFTKAAFESDVILRESIAEVIAAQPDFAGDPTVRLEVWSEYLELGDPRVATRMLEVEKDPVARAGMVQPDVTDEVLDFGELLFIAGKAFATGREPLRDAKSPAEIDLSPDAKGQDIQVAKHWFRSEGGRAFLIESVKGTELQALMAALPPAKALPPAAAKTKTELATTLQSAKGATRAPRSGTIQVTDRGAYTPKGLILDYRNVATSGAETLLTGETVYVSGTTYLTTLTIQPGCVVKCADNAYLLAYTSVSCQAVAANPAWFTSKNDDSIGDTLPGSTGVPSQMANPGFWMYYIPAYTTLANLHLRWCKIGIKCDSSGAYSHTLSDSWFEQCTTGLACTGGSGTLMFLNNVKYCGVTTPTTGTGISGSMTADCLTSFATTTITAASDKPGAMVLGDLNDDQRPDMVTANTTGNSLSVRLGNADGTFGTPSTLLLGAAPSGLALADVNQDLWLDIIVTHSASAQVSILLGSAAGTFSAPFVFSTGAGSSPVAVAVGDLDGNFTPDLVVASSQNPNGTIRVLLRAAAASPTSVSYGTAQSFPVGAAPKSLVLADFNRDGKLDAGVANEGSGTISILNGTGTGGFGTAVSYNTGTAASRLPRSIVAEDFDLDGFIDLAVANYQSSTIGILKNLPAAPGTFGTALELSTSAGNKPRSIAIADVDGDTWTDLIAANESGTSLISVFRGFGAGAWGTRMDFGSSAAASFVQSRDLNRDGRPDVVVSNPSGTGSYLVALNSSPIPLASFSAKVDTALGSAADAIAVGRLTTDAGANIDVNVDVAVATAAGNKVRIYGSDGNGVFTFSADLNVPGGSSQPVAIALGDLDRNGYLDVVTANYNAGGPSTITRWLKSATDASYGAGVSYNVGSGARAVVLANFDEDPDGKLDAVVANGAATSNNLSFLAGNGDGTFAAAQTVSLGAVSSPQPWALAVGRFDSDYHLDLAVADWGAGKLTILTGYGNGTFAEKAPLTSGTHPVAVAVGDFDRNGRDDVVVANEGSNTIKVFLNDGLANFTSGAGDTYTTGSQPNGLTIFDLNMDGWVDICVTCKGQSKVQVFLGLGNGKFLTQAQDFATAGSPVTVAAVHLNNDSMPDLVVGGASGSMSRLLNNRATIPQVVSFAFPLQKNMNLSKRAGPDDESAIAINRANPENLVAVCAQSPEVGQGFTKSYSLTGGRTWETATVLPAQTGTTDSDPSLSFDRFGNLYFAYLVPHEDGTPDQIRVRRSVDGGAAFANDDLFVALEGDQPTVVVGPSGADYAESIWVVYHSVFELSSSAVSARLSDGSTFAAPVPVNVTIGSDPFAISGIFGDLAIGPGGAVVVAAQAQSGLVGLHTFLRSEMITPFPWELRASLPAPAMDNAYRTMIPPQPSRGAGAEVGVAWDRSHGPRSGRLYMVYTDKTPQHYTLNPASGKFEADATDDTDIILRTSDDSGLHWSDPLRVNSDLRGASQFQPRIALDQKTGNVAISYLDPSSDPAGVKVRHHLAVSLDGGRSFVHHTRVSQGESDATLAPPVIPNVVWDFLEYHGLDFHDSTIAVSWADNSNFTADAPDHTPTSRPMEMYFAKLKVR